MNGRSTPRRRPAWPSPLTGALICALILALAIAVVGCGSGGDGSVTTVTPAQTSFPVTVTDDNGSTVTISATPQRIVSASPAATQILFALGVGDRVVGVNKWDEYPAEVLDLPKVADLQVNTEAVMALSPDLVFGAAGQEEALAAVEAAGAPVLIFDPKDLDGIYANITTAGKAVGAEETAAQVVSSMRGAIADLAEAVTASGEAPTVFYAMDETLYTCGLDTFVDELLGLASATNVASQPQADGTVAMGYFPFTPEQLVAADPDMVILGAFYGGVEKFTSDPRFAGLTAVKEGRVFVLDDQYDKLLTLAAPRIAEGFKALVETIHPGIEATK